MFRVFTIMVTLIFILFCNGVNVTSSAIDSTDGISTPVLATVYVDSSATGNDDGTTWDNAFKDLQAGIDDAAKKVSGNEVVRVHVAIGIYKPSGWPSGGSANREKHFALKNGVEVYGGYPRGGGSSATGDKTETILSGDIGSENNDSDNVYHVFYHPDATQLTESARIENVTITKGNAGGGGIHNYGGGMVNINNSNPTLVRVAFTSNKASDSGGGMYNKGISPKLTEVTFTNNEASYGAGIYNESSSPILKSVTFSDNKASYYGSGIANINNSNPSLNGVSFTRNNANSGGGIYNLDSSPTLTSCQFTDNRADSVGGAMFSSGDSNPRFIDNPLVPTNPVESRDNGYFKT